MTRAVVLGAVAAVAAGAAAGSWAFGSGPFAHRVPAEVAAAVSGPVPVATATVTRGTITVSEDDPGTVGYAGGVTVYSAAAGTVTWLPAGGAVIRPGRRLFAVDGQDTVLMRGRTPAWRPFWPGMSDGPDVAELQRNLVALGYDPYHAITPGDHYDWATQAAVERWQAAHDWWPDGQVPLGRVAFLPGAVRVAGQAAGTGATVAPGAPVLAATSTTAVVTVAMPAEEQSAVRTGQRVTITRPDGTTSGGRVLGPAPSTPPAQNPSADTGASGSGGAGSGGAGSGGAGSGGAGSSGPATASILVTLDGQADAGRLDGAQVQVQIVTQAQHDVLVTPISALLAAPGGAYQVTVVAGRSRRNVTVRTGLFDDIGGTVAISGPGIADGTRVEVPRS